MVERQTQWSVRFDKAWLLPCCLWAMVSLLIGCDVLDDVTKITICTNEETFVLDTASMGVPVGGATLPVIGCDAATSVCDAAGTLLTCTDPVTCTGRCAAAGGAGERHCALDVRLNARRDIDLSQQVNSSLKARVLSSVTLRRVEYTVVANSLTVDTPEITFFVGPQASQLPADANVTALGSLAPIRAGQTSALQLLTVTPAGQTAISGFVQDYQHPFALLGQAALVLEGGAAVPSGKIEVHAKACLQGDLL